ncbi:hypothetical protein [Corynebacterium freneyi]|uniref:Uncharacterized protein n=1 Tax=Corynebacterium freneyi DNF00450 TaxID=1287475 RepID=A0A095Y5R1_9CORY|nr:hypothetical protein [Corynebacterium freneyi]KGF17351.1 hypothetical protein HMPREF1650_04060 [Corynebacterium freneyi DNF00450]
MTTTAHDIAATIHHKHGVTFDFAAEAVETYIAQVEDVDGRDIDREEILDDDAEFIITVFASAQRAGDFGIRQLDDVADAADAVDVAQATLDQAMADRDRAIRHALAHGARVTDVVAAAGVTRARIDQIRQGRR